MTGANDEGEEHEQKGIHMISSHDIYMLVDTFSFVTYLAGQEECMYV